MTAMDIARIVLFCVMLMAAVIVTVVAIRRADRRSEVPVASPGEQRASAQQVANLHARRGFDSMHTGP